MKNENYIVIQGWMINTLKLSGNELIVYALIYGFSQDNESVFRGSLNYMCKALSISKPTVVSILKKLVDKKLIDKKVVFVDEFKVNEYSISSKETLPGGSKETLPGGSKETLPGGSKETLPGGSKETLPGGSKETLPYNYNIDNTSNINIDNNTPKPPKGDSIDFEGLINFFNSTFGKNSKVISDTVKMKYKARLKEGYTKEDIVNAMMNAKKSEFHKESNYNYCTLELFSRPDKLDQWINYKDDTNTDIIKTYYPR